MTSAAAGDAPAVPRQNEPSAVGLVALLPLAILYYGFLLTAAGQIGLFAPLDHGLTFNSMLLHLLHGRFDVDPAVIGEEGYLRDGAVYAYFGILPSLLRAPALLLPQFATTDLTRLSCLVAVALMAVFKLLSALIVWRSAAAPRRPVLLTLLVAAILFGGAEIQFLRPSLFVESVMWSGALAAIFVYLLLRGWTREDGFTAVVMSLLALVAGLCLLTRVSTAVGLFLALALLWLRHAAAELRRSDRERARRLAGLAAPVLVLAAFAAVAAFVNLERWGNPFVFVDLTRALIAPYFPERLQRVREYGEFNLVRLGFGLVYYFFPVWVLRDGSGQLLWSDFVARTLDAAELPPSTFFLSDPLLVGLTLYGLLGLATGRGVMRRIPVALAGIGLAVPPALMLIAISMAFRYRMEFYPVLELLAFLGFRRVVETPRRGAVPAFAAVALAGIVMAHALWVLNAASPFGPAGRILGQRGIVEFYGGALH